jgi:hypothetical protein
LAKSRVDAGQFGEVGAGESARCRTVWSTTREEAEHAVDSVGRACASVQTKRSAVRRTRVPGIERDGPIGIWDGASKDVQIVVPVVIDEVANHKDGVEEEAVARARAKQDDRTSPKVSQPDRMPLGLASPLLTARIEELVTKHERVGVP